MKLAASNLKRAALRVNPSTTLTSFNNRTGDKEQVKYRTGFVPSIKNPDAVPAPSMSIWKQPVYKPDTRGYQRPGADHSQIKSRGL
jgi:hypothetical protein